MRKRYTLIELIVVVGVIAILVSLFFSAMKVGMQKMEGTECANRQRSLGVGFFEYNSDYGYLPPVNAAANWGNAPGATHNYSGVWWNSLGEYFKYHEVGLGVIPTQDVEYGNPFSCPTAEKLNSDGYYDDKGGIYSWNSIVGYGMNLYTWTSQYPTHNYSFSTPPDIGYNQYTIRSYASRFKNPTNLQLVADARYLTPGSTWSTRQPENSPYYYHFDRVRHGGEANVLFSDGRVLLRSEEYWLEKNMEHWNVNFFWRDLESFQNTVRSFD